MTPSEAHHRARLFRIRGEIEAGTYEPKMNVRGVDRLIADLAGGESGDPCRPTNSFSRPVRGVRMFRPRGVGE